MKTLELIRLLVAPTEGTACAAFNKVNDVLDAEGIYTELIRSLPFILKDTAGLEADDVEDATDEIEQAICLVMRAVIQKHLKAAEANHGTRL